MKNFPNRLSLNRGVRTQRKRSAWKYLDHMCPYTHLFACALSSLPTNSATKIHLGGREGVLSCVSYTYYTQYSYSCRPTSHEFSFCSRVSSRLLRYCLDEQEHHHHHHHQPRENKTSSSEAHYSSSTLKTRTRLVYMARFSFRTRKCQQTLLRYCLDDNKHHHPPRYYIPGGPHENIFHVFGDSLQYLE